MKLVDFILILLLLVLIAIMFFGIYMIKTQGAKCIFSPLTYGAEKLGEKYGEMSCACTNGISFDKFNMTRVIKPYYFKG